MKILGVSGYYHDASAAIVIDGKVIASSAEERFSRRKHDPAFPLHAIRYCLKEAGITGDQLDFTVFHEDPFTKLTRTTATSFSEFPRSLGTFLKMARDAVSGGTALRSTLCERVGTNPEKVIFAPHHMSHAAHAFFTSPYQEAAVMTIDAVGEWTSSAIFKGAGNRLEPVDVSPFPHSLGLVYSAFTAFLGFKVNEGECSVMALAAFGKPVYADQVRRIVRVSADGSYTVDLDWFDFRDGAAVPVTTEFRSTFGEPRSPREKIDFAWFEDRGATRDQQRYADIAASIQTVFEEAVTAYARRAKMLTGAESLCYAGGGALNCVANSTLMRSGIFSNIYIPPDPGDGGGALGAALYLAALRDPAFQRFSLDPYCGTEVVADEVAPMFSHLGVSKWHQFSRMKLSPLNNDGIKIYQFDNIEKTLNWTAQRLLKGKIVGWCQGRAENGPRALGNRSILIRPDDTSLARRLSEQVKLRAAFRPYSAAMTDREAERCLAAPWNSSTAKWMQFSCPVRQDSQNDLKAALHRDGTTRVQRVERSENATFYDLLARVGELTGREALLNTSFNESGYPLVNDASDAIMMFARTSLDVLVVGNCALEKQ